MQTNRTQIREPSSLGDFIKAITTMNKITSQNDFINLRRMNADTYIVGSIDSNGIMSFSTQPTVQTSASAAAAECDRLSRITPGKMYIFARLAGGSMCNTITRF